jgi:hypothetical protein
MAGCDPASLQLALERAGHAKSALATDPFSGVQFSSTFSSVSPSASMATRLNPNGQRARCTVPKSVPGTSAASARYREHSFQVDPGPSQCLIVRMTSSCGLFDLLPVAYLGSFDPANPAGNYLGDPGVVNASSEFAINAPGGSTPAATPNSPSRGRVKIPQLSARDGWMVTRSPDGSQRERLLP